MGHVLSTVFETVSILPGTYTGAAATIVHNYVTINIANIQASSFSPFLFCVKRIAKGEGTKKTALSKNSTIH